MRIGVDVSCWSNKRGFGRFTRELLKALINFDKENEYLFFVDDHTAIQSEFPEGVQIKVISTNESPTSAASASGRRSLNDMWAMTRDVSKYILDIFFFPAVYSFFPIINRTKIIVTIHDMIPRLYPEEVFPNEKLRFFWNLKENLSVWQSRLVLTVSQHSKQKIMKYHNLSESRIAIVTEGPETIFRKLPQDIQSEQILELFNLTDSKRYLLYVGGISPHKNLHTLFQAFSDLTKDASFADVKLVLVGDYQYDSFYSDYPALQTLSKNLQLEDKVIFTGYIEDDVLVYLYNAASLLVFPSLQEGFGLPAVEAMACGTPVAASNAGSLPEILGDAGQFFDPYSSQHMHSVIKNILSDDVLKNEMSSRGLSRAKDFTWGRAAKDLVSIFTNLEKE